MQNINSRGPKFDNFWNSTVGGQWSEQSGGSDGRGALPAPTWKEFKRCHPAHKNKSAGCDGETPHLVRRLPPHLQQELYNAIVDICRGNKITKTWPAVVLI